MNRTELQRLVKERVREAKVLLAARCWWGAYYLAGYAVECALKACVLAYVERSGMIFQDRKYAEKCWTHDLELLVDLAGLKADRDAHEAVDAEYAANWQTVQKWNESSRYVRNTEAKARELFDAITDKKHGVLSWIKAHW
jgi:hypothetical protein